MCEALLSLGGREGWHFWLPRILCTWCALMCCSAMEGPCTKKSEKWSSYNIVPVNITAFHCKVTENSRDSTCGWQSNLFLIFLSQGV